MPPFTATPPTKLPGDERAARPRPLSVVEASEGLVSFRVLVEARDVVFLKGVLEASDGVACVFAESGGDLTVAAPAGRVVELLEILNDLAADIGARVIEPA
jgi:hypothetical protein